MKIVKERHAHLANVAAVGTFTCPRCKSELRAERSDFERERRPNAPPGKTKCPVAKCGYISTENEWTWGVDPDVEKRAREAYSRSQDHLHNLHTQAWETLPELTRAEWRARVASAPERAG